MYIYLSDYSDVSVIDPRNWRYINHVVIIIIIIKILHTPQKSRFFVNSGCFWRELICWRGGSCKSQLVTVNDWNNTSFAFICACSISLADIKFLYEIFFQNIVFKLRFVCRKSTLEFDINVSCILLLHMIFVICAGST